MFGLVAGVWAWARDADEASAAAAVAVSRSRRVREVEAGMHSRIVGRRLEDSDLGAAKWFGGIRRGVVSQLSGSPCKRTRSNDHQADFTIGVIGSDAGVSPRAGPLARPPTANPCARGRFRPSPAIDCGGYFARKPVCRRGRFWEACILPSGCGRRARARPLRRP